MTASDLPALNIAELQTLLRHREVSPREVVEALRNRMFRILLDNGHETLGYTAGKMRRYRIRIFLGDRVRVELSPYDLDRGRIVYRFK